MVKIFWQILLLEQGKKLALLTTNQNTLLWLPVDIEGQFMLDGKV